MTNCIQTEVQDKILEFLNKNINSMFIDWHYYNRLLITSILVTLPKIKVKVNLNDKLIITIKDRTKWFFNKKVHRFSQIDSNFRLKIEALVYEFNSNIKKDKWFQLKKDIEKIL